MMISFDDFQKVEIRVGRIIEAMEFPEARKKAYRLAIDFGPFGIKRSSAQITDLYTMIDLAGRLILAVTNLAPRRIAGFQSEVLVLGLYRDDGVVLIRPDDDVAPGTLLS